MKKIMLMIIIVLSSILMYQNDYLGGCDLSFLYDDPMAPIIEALGGIEQ